MVVSEIGEQWSPNTPPDKHAPIINSIGIPNCAATGSAIGIVMAHTPQELPVENPTNAPTMKITIGMIPGAILDTSTKCTM